MHIYTRSKLPWVRIPEGARSFDAFYDMKQEPAESQERRRQASDRAKLG